MLLFGESPIRWPSSFNFFGLFEIGSGDVKNKSFCGNFYCRSIG